MRKPVKTIVGLTFALVMAIFSTPLGLMPALAEEASTQEQPASVQEEAENPASSEATAEDEVAPVTQVATSARTATAIQNGVTFTVTWDDVPAGQATTFHVTQTGGSNQAKARMDVPAYWDIDGSQESVCDPTRDQWGSYHELGDDGYDFTFELTASGTYRINFYFMDTVSNVWYLRTTAVITVSDPSRPSVTQMVSDAVAQCRRKTDGSEYAMALWLHDWELDQLEYDRSLNYCSAESGLTRHLGTCESYQRIYAKLLNAAGIANGRVEGNGHTWNAVKIDGKWCQMDPTWDDTSDNWYGDLDQRHLYFGLTDELMAIAHSDHTKNYQADGYAYRSTDLSNNYFVRNGKAAEWAEKYADRIQQHLDAKETSFSIDADNQSFPPSISGIQNALVAYAINQRAWSTGDGTVMLTATSNVTTVSNYQWSAKFDFEAEYPNAPIKKLDIAQAEINITDAEYNGEPREPVTKVTLAGADLIEGTDYTVGYSDNVTPGIATVTVIGIGNYEGTAHSTFTISARSDAAKFVSRLYKYAANRRADDSGFAYWLSIVERTGYEEAASGILSSPEILRKAGSNARLVEIAYESLLNREPDEEGKSSWVKSLDNGLTPANFARSIVKSNEFIRKHPKMTIEDFVKNLYVEALGRTPDEEGLTYWTKTTTNMQNARKAIASTFLSQEFEHKQLSQEETVRRIYRAALMRDPDNKGLLYYAHLLTQNANASEVVSQITSSQEFVRTLAQCGLG